MAPQPNNTSVRVGVKAEELLRSGFDFMAPQPNNTSVRVGVKAEELLWKIEDRRSTGFSFLVRMGVAPPFPISELDTHAHIMTVLSRPATTIYYCIRS